MMSSTRGILVVLSRRGVHGYQKPLNQYAHKLAVPRFSSTSSSSNNASWASKFISGLENYRRSLKWVPIPLSVGFAYICYQQYGHIKERERRKVFGTYKPQDFLASERQSSRHNLFEQPMFHLHSATCKRQLDCNEPYFESLRYIIQQGMPFLQSQLCVMLNLTALLWLNDGFPFKVSPITTQLIFAGGRVLWQRADDVGCTK